MHHRAAKKTVRWKKPSVAHESTANTSLPPSVDGPITGRLNVKLLQIKWDFNIPPPAPRLHVRLKWWGEAGAGTIFKVPVVSSVRSTKATQSPTSAFYSIKANWRKMSAYLNDMGSLILDIGLGDISNEAMLIGQTVVKHIGRLSLNTPIEEYCEIANSDGITLGTIWVKLSMSSIKQEERPQQLPSTEEFVVGPAVRRHHHIQSPIKQFNKVDAEELEDVTMAGDAADQPSSVAFSTKSSTKKEAIGLLLDQSKRLREAMINSILDTEGTIKAAEDLYSNDQLGRPEQLEGVTEFMRGQQQVDYPSEEDSFVGRPLSSDSESCDIGGTNRIVDLVLKGHRIKPHRKYHSRRVVLNRLISTDEDEDLEDSILTDSSGPMHNRDLLNELLYAQDKDKSDESSLVIPAAAFDSTTSSKSSDSLVVKDKEDLRKQDDQNVTEVACSHDVPLSKGPVSGVALEKGLGRQGEIKENNILGGIGLDRLTKLGRVNAAKVLVGRVIVLRSSSDHDGQPPRKDRGTYFVEYRFPVVNRRHGSKHAQYEVTRVASKKILDQTIRFSHRSVFPLAFSSEVVNKWWNGLLFFRLYYRTPGERMPQLIGRASLPLRRVLRAPQFCLVTELSIRSMTLQQAVDQDVEEEEDVVQKIGTMRVRVVLLPAVGKTGNNDELNSSSVASGSDMEIEEHMMESKIGLGAEIGKNFDGVNSNKPPHPPLLQLLLMIPDGCNLAVPSSSTTTSQQDSTETPPNSYLICKLFCCDPYPKTQTIWSSTNPIFSFKQIFPLLLSKSLLVKMCNNFIIIEVWHKTAGGVPDILVGLVKITLHQFFLAFSDEDTLPSLMEGDYPVVAMDSYCPIVDPISAKIQGYLGVLLALGNPAQVSHITKEFLAGEYKVHRPHYSHESSPHQSTPAQSHFVSDANFDSKGAATDDGNSEVPCQHVFEVVVEGIRNLSVFTNTVWGEADCFVQYHFPKQHQEQQLEETGRQAEQVSMDDMQLHPYRTNTTLCIPDPSFSHETRHILILPSGIPVQKALMTCYRAGGMGIELWKRFYYPNIRDQLVAKTTLPTAKLCALVTMRRMATAGIQSFTLPLALTLKSSQSDSGGLVDLTIKYYSVRSGQSAMTAFPTAGDGDLQNQVTISVGILRAVGLKDAALRACKDSPVSMAFAAEVGVNAYVKLKLPLLSAKNEYTTKTIARAFAPEFSHFFDISLPVKLGNRGHSTVPTSLAERLEHTSAMLEVWHCMPKHQTTTTSSSDGTHTTHALFGRRMGGALRDVLLGSVEVPLSSLLIKHTGINGWFPLVATGSGYEALPTVEQSTNNNCVGGVELSVNFNSAEDRTAVLQAGARLGWLPSDKGTDISSSSLLVVHIEGALLPVEMVTIPTQIKEKYKLCYVRYKFYDRVPVVSKPYPITSLTDDRAFYKIFHSSSTQLTSTESLKWYLLEESLEMQLWLCGSSAGGRDISRPDSRDVLVGTASIPLLPLACGEGHNDTITIKDSFILFKAGLNSLSGQCIYAKITITPISKGSHHSSGSATDKNMIITESEDLASGYQSSVAHSEGFQDTSSLSSAETVANSKEEDSTKPPPVPLEEMFQANVAIHEALHVCLPKGFQDNGVVYCYVAMQPHPGLDKIVTPAVECSANLIVWGTQALTRIPLTFLSQQCGSLQFHLWGKDASGREEHIGIVHLDLTPLASGLQQLCGWYHIVDHTGQPKGQMKLSVTPTSRLAPSKSALLLSKKCTVSAPTGEQENFDDVPDDCTSSFLVNHLRQNIHELDVIHKNLEARLEQLETRNLTTSNAHQLNVQPDHQHQSLHDTIHLNSGQHLSDVHQGNQPLQVDQRNHNLRVDRSDQQQREQVLYRNQSDHSAYNTGPLMSSDPQLHDHHSNLDDDQHVQSSETVTSSYNQSEPISSRTTAHVQYSDEQPLRSSSVEYSESISSCSSSSSNVSSDHSADIEIDPPASSVHPHAVSTVETPVHITHRSSSSSSIVLSDSCVSDSEDEGSPVEADGLPYGRDRTAPFAAAVPDDHMIQVSIVSNLTTVTPTELSSQSGNENSEHQSSTGEDNREQNETMTTASSDSSEELSSPSATSLVTQSLLNRDDHIREGTNSLRDITNGISQPSPNTLHQEDEQILFSAPPSQSPTQKSSPKRFRLGNIPPKIQLPNFFMPPHELEQTMRRLKMTALTRPPPRELEQVCASNEKQQLTQPTAVEERTGPNLSLQDMQRVARIFASKPS